MPMALRSPSPASGPARLRSPQTRSSRGAQGESACSGRPRRTRRPWRRQITTTTEGASRHRMAPGRKTPARRAQRPPQPRRARRERGAARAAQAALALAPNSSSSRLRRRSVPWSGAARPLSGQGKSSQLGRRRAEAGAERQEQEELPPASQPRCQPRRWRVRAARWRREVLGGAQCQLQGRAPAQRLSQRHRRPC